MSKEKIIRVKAVYDEEFKNSYWSFNIQKNLKMAFSEFKRQFGIGFEITEIGKWDSIGSPELRNFPLNVLKQLPKRTSGAEVVDGLVEIINNQMRIPWGISQKIKKRFCTGIRKESKNCQLGYLMGYFSGFLSDYLLADLMKKTPEKTEADIVVGFTGKIVVFPEEQIFPVGRAVRGADLGKDAYAIVGICIGLRPCPSQIILHEIGHLFGAKDIKNTVFSVMNQKTITYNFDEENKKTIKHFLTKLG